MSTIIYLLTNPSNTKNVELIIPELIQLFPNIKNIDSSIFKDKKTTDINHSDHTKILLNTSDIKYKNIQLTHYVTLKSYILNYIAINDKSNNIYISNNCFLDACIFNRHLFLQNCISHLDYLKINKLISSKAKLHIKHINKIIFIIIKEKPDSTNHQKLDLENINNFYHHQIPVAINLLPTSVIDKIDVQITSSEKECIIKVIKNLLSKEKS